MASNRSFASPHRQICSKKGRSAYSTRPIGRSIILNEALAPGASRRQRPAHRIGKSPRPSFTVDQRDGNPRFDQSLAAAQHRLIQDNPRTLHFTHARVHLDDIVYLGRPMEGKRHLRDSKMRPFLGQIGVRNTNAAEEIGATALKKADVSAVIDQT